MTPKLQIFIGIMAFYALLAYVVFPVGFYYLVDKSLASAGNGFIVGSVVSVILWLFVGKKLIE
jgi:hypothetical protein